MENVEKVEVIEEVIEDLANVARKLRSMGDRYVDLYVTNHIGGIHDEPSTFGGMIARLRAHIDDLTLEAADQDEEDESK